MKNKPELYSQKKKKDVSTENSIWYFSIILFVGQRFLLYRNVYNVPFWKSILIFSLIGITLFLILKGWKRVSRPINTIFKGASVYTVLVISIGSTIIGISNKIYTLNQDLVSITCEILHVSEGGGRLSSHLVISLDNNNIDLTNTFSPDIIQGLKRNSKSMSNSNVYLTYKKGLFGMIQVEDACVTKK